MKYLFVGNFFIHTRGTTKPVSHRVISRLKADFNLDIGIAGIFSNKILRVADIFYKSLFGRYSTIHIDVFSGPSFYLALLAAFLGDMRGRKVILNLRGGALMNFDDKYPRLTELLFNRAAVLVSPSLFLKEYYLAKGFEVVYLPNYLDFDGLAPKRATSNRYSLLWVRAFTKIYNPEIAIKALHQVLKRYPQATLTMIGPDMGLRSYCENLVMNLNLNDKVRFVGPVKHQDLQTYYLSHSILLNTTSFESFGNAVMEAAYYGTPTISYRVGEIPYLWEDGVNILLTKNLTSNDFADKIVFLFDDFGFNQAISQNAKKKAALFTWNIVKENWYKLLK